jgi:hypothetical protein
MTALDTLSRTIRARHNMPDPVVLIAYNGDHIDDQTVNIGWQDPIHFSRRLN